MQTGGKIGLMCNSLLLNQIILNNEERMVRKARSGTKSACQSDLIHADGKGRQ